MKILTDKYLVKYCKLLKDLDENYKLFLSNSKKLDFKYLTESSSVFSSNIEWNSLDLNSFMNQKLNSSSLTKDAEEIENLINSYEFAQENKLSEKNLLEIHKISSKTILIKSKRWKYRQDKVWVFWSQWLIYLAIEAEFVEEKMKELFEDIEKLIENKLSLEETFYYASQIHLKFVHIHPFSDWNWRTARILEKWFLSEKLWQELWKINSEEFYKENRENYYNNINLWVNYYELNYENSINFMKMLVFSLEK